MFYYYSSILLKIVIWRDSGVLYPGLAGFSGFLSTHLTGNRQYLLATLRNSSSVVSDLWPHTVRLSTHPLQDFGWEVLNYHPIARTSHPVISIFSYTSRNSCPVSVSVFIMAERRRWVSQQTIYFVKRLLVRDRVMTCTSGTSRVLIVASLQRLKMEALISALAYCEVHLW